MPRDRTLTPLFFLVASIAVVAALYVAKPILLPIALAVLLSFLLSPLANRIERLGLPRVPTVILVVAIAFSVLGVLGWIVMSQLIELRQELPNHREKIIAKVQSLKQLTKQVEDMGAELTNEAEVQSKETKDKRKETPRPPTSNGRTSGDGEKHSGDRDSGRVPAEAPHSPVVSGIEEFAATGELPTAASDGALAVKVVATSPSMLMQIQTWLGPLVAPLTTAGMVIVLVFFILLDRENQRNRFIQLLGTENLHRTTEAITDATHRVGRYLQMQFLINAGYGVAVATGLWFLGVPSAIMWGVLGFSLRFLPYLGPWIAAVMPILVSVAVSDGWTQPMLVMCMYVVYELLLNNVAEPMLYGSSIGVSTVGVIIAAIFWTWLWGPIGLVLAMPMTVCIVVLARYVPQLRFITVLLADQQQLSPAERVYQRLLAGDDDEPLKIARTHLKESALVSFYDEILVPALVLAENDRHAGLLTDEQAALVEESADSLVDELGEEMTSKTAETELPVNERRSEQVLCIPLRDEADAIASKMLLQLLAAEGFSAEAGAASALTGESIDHVASSQSDIAILSVLPPIRPRESRLLWKGLRQRYPDLPIIVGYWVGAHATESLVPPPGDKSSKVATTLAQAIALVHSAAAQLRTKSDAHVDVPNKAKSA